MLRRQQQQQQIQQQQLQQQQLQQQQQQQLTHLSLLPTPTGGGQFQQIEEGPVTVAGTEPEADAGTTLLALAWALT